MKQIIFLLEACEDIQSIRKQSESDKNFALTFKKSNSELNELHLAFNQVAKIINIGNQSTKRGEESKMIL